MKTTTLGEWGAKLPIGFPEGKNLNKSFQLRPFKAKIDRHLGHWLEANSERYSPGQLIAYQTVKLVSLLCTQAGGKQMPISENGDSTAESELQILNWYFADLLYVYLFARVQTLGPELAVNVACQNLSCKSRVHGAKFDLNTLEVRVAETIDETAAHVTLRKPIRLRNNDLLRKLKVGPVRWSTMAKPNSMSGSMSGMSLGALQDAVCAIGDNDTPYTLIESEVDELEKVDRIRIDREIERVSAGVKLATELTCPACGTPIVNPLNWTYEYFFEESLPQEISMS